MRKNNLVAPVVKWVGGKRQLLDEITPRLPKRITSYCEPFLGGGAALFFIQFMLSNSATEFVKDLYKDYTYPSYRQKGQSVQTLKNAGQLRKC